LLCPWKNSHKLTIILNKLLSELFPGIILIKVNSRSQLALMVKYFPTIEKSIFKFILFLLLILRNCLCHI